MHIIDEAPNYYLTADCKVHNNITGKEIKPRLSGSGYPVVSLRHNGIYVNLSMHVLVAKYILGVTGQVIEHKDDNKANYSPDNLKASTQSANITKAMGIPVKGTKGSETIYCNTAAEAARLVNCEPSRITAICRNKVGYKTAGGYTWKYA
jgi:hypothetical protein